MKNYSGVIQDRPTERAETVGSIEIQTEQKEAIKSIFMSLKEKLEHVLVALSGKLKTTTC